ncbi:hypothetical protein [Streptomyces sp. NPDC058272]|uniref:hypothetical protein n=1 Tax=Streptomyces sp. NPDC058272 TaxID=3346415 RepID=UPI0036F16258
MKYLDNDGDVWEEHADDLFVCVRSFVAGFEGAEKTRSALAAEFGPLHPMDAADTEPHTGLPTVADVMSRASVFQAAHALVQGLEWDEKASVYDVLQVAKWLEGDA